MFRRGRAPARTCPLAMGAALLVGVGLAVGACASRGTTTNSDPVGNGGTAGVGVNATVERVVDGDTIVASVNGSSEKVRLVGIDTPETHKPDTPVECFGTEASERLSSLLPAGTPIRLERDVEERDRYERLLAYAYRGSDGLFVNLAMARDGFAAQLTIPPNVAHADEFGTAAREAREQRRGLWGRCAGPHVGAQTPPPAGQANR